MIELNKIYCENCVDVMKRMSNNTVNVIIADPPYGIDYQSSWKIDKSKRLPRIANDKTPYTEWLKEAYRVLVDGGCILCFTRYDVENKFREEMRECGFVDKAQVIWDKVVHGMGDLRGDFAPQHENIIFAVKGRFMFPNKRPKSIIRVSRVSAEKLIHPNEKPIELINILLDGVAGDGHIILDPFVGSGVIPKACQLRKLPFIGMELDEGYCEIARKRLQQ